ncbi:Calcium-binding protein NCS-1 [Binucleata daphniae]
MGNIKSNVYTTPKATLLKFSHFSPQSVKLWDAEFHTLFPSGFVTHQDVDKIFKNLFPFGSPANFTKLLFRTIDICDSQKIGFNEFVITFSILTKGSKYEKLRWVFRFFDNDCDGFISKPEMLRAVQSIYDMCGYMFDLEVNVRNVVESLFCNIENESGFITFDDFKKLAESNPKVMKQLTLILDY